MPLPPKSLITLAEVASNWNMTVQDIACYALDGRLTLSVVLHGVPVEVGAWVDVGAGEQPQRASHGYRWLTGIYDVVGLDIWPVFQNGSVAVQQFKAGSPDEFMDIRDNGHYDVYLQNLYVRRDEYLRFSKDHGLDPIQWEGPRGPRGGPGQEPRWEWDAFWIKVCARIYNDGLPKTRAALTRELLTWFDENYDASPDFSTVRKKISSMWNALHASSTTQALGE